MANVQVPPPVGTSGQAIDALIINAASSELRQIHVVADPVSSSAMATVTTSGGLSVNVTNLVRSLSSGTIIMSSVQSVTATAATNPWSSAPGFNVPMVSASSGFMQISGTAVIVSASSGLVQISGVPAVTVQGSSGGTVLVSSAGFMMVTAELSGIPAVTVASGAITLSSVHTVTATAATNPWSSAPGFNVPLVSASSGLVQISGTPFFNLVGTSSGVAIVTTSGGLNVSIVAGAVGSTVVNLSSATALSSGVVTLSSVHTVTATAATNPWSSAPGFNMPVVNASSGMVQTLPASTGPLLSVTYVSSSSTNSNNVKGTPGAFYGFYAFNSTQSIRYIKLYNTTSAPTAGTTANQIGNYGIPYSTGGAGAVHPMPYGVSASNGIGFTIVSGIETTSTGTIGASDVALTVYYI